MFAVCICASAHAQMTYPPTLTDERTGQSISASTTKCIILIHGWNPSGAANCYDINNGFEWFNFIINLKAQLNGSSWGLLTYHWETDADTGSIWPNLLINDFFDLATASTAAFNAQTHGYHLATQLNQLAPNLREVQFIAHSAGSWAARQAAQQLLQLNPYVIVQITLLDPFVPDPSGSSYGGDYSDSAMSGMPSFSGNDRILRLENYYANDSPEHGWNPAPWGDLTGPTYNTQETFAWRSGIDINQEVDWGTTIIGTPPYKPNYDWHAGPIQFYSDCVSANLFPTTVPSGLQGTGCPFVYQQIGWKRSLYSLESFLPQITGQPANQSAQTGGSATFNVTASQATSYEWYKVGGGYIGSGASLTLNGISVGNAGSYVVRVSNANGQLYSQSATLTVQASPSAISLSCSVSPSTGSPNFPFTVSGTAIYNNGGGLVSAGTVTILVGGQTWTAAINNGSYSRQVTAPASSGNYQVSVTALDGIGRTGANSASIAVDPNGTTSGYVINSFLTCQSVDTNPTYDPIGVMDAFGSDDSQFYAWLELGNVVGAHPFEFRLYRPDGTYYSSLYGTAGVTGVTYPQYWVLGPWSVNGTDIPNIPGRWSVKLYIDGSYKQSIAFTMRYQLTEHMMAKDVHTSDPYDPIQPGNIFYQTDQKAMVWLNLAKVSNPLDVKWTFYEPNGSQYWEAPFTSDDPNLFGRNYWEYYKLWCPINIAGYSAAYKCGDWSVDVFIKNASGSWVKQYTDYFQILESPMQPPVCEIAADPANPIAGQSITINAAAADNTYLKSMVLHWKDSSEHTITWNSLFRNSLSQYVDIGSFPAGQQIEYWAVATDTSGNTTESIHHTVSVLPQYTINASAGSGGTISPSGNLTRNAGDSQQFTASPNANYVVNQWTVDASVMQTGGTSYTLTNIQTGHSVQVTFATNFIATGTTYVFSAPVSAHTAVALSFGSGSLGGGSQITFGTLNETLYYNPIAGTLRHVGSVTFNPTSVFFTIFGGLFYNNDTEQHLW